MGVYIGQDKVSTYLKINTYENNEVILSNVNLTPTGVTTTIPASQYSADGFQNVTIMGDANLVPSNIKSGVSIYGVLGSMVSSEARLRMSTIYPSTSDQNYIPGENYDGFSSITLKAVDSSIDPNIIPGNIKAGVSILGVQGTLTSSGTIVSGTLNIAENGSYDVTNYSGVIVNIPVNTEIPAGYILPSGNLNITSNGNYNVKIYETVSIDVPIPTGYIRPISTIELTVNGTHDVTEASTAIVNVPIPSGYIIPSGSQDITINGTYDITGKASVVVDVDTSKPEMTTTVTPSESTQIITPDTGKVFSAVTVNPIPNEYIVPSGTMTITTPGEYNISAYNNVNVQIEPEAHSYYYGENQPSNPTEGLIWFRPI